MINTVDSNLPKLIDYLEKSVFIKLLNGIKLKRLIDASMEIKLNFINS